MDAFRQLIRKMAKPKGRRTTSYQGTFMVAAGLFFFVSILVEGGSIGHADIALAAGLVAGGIGLLTARDEDAEKPPDEPQKPKDDT